MLGDARDSLKKLAGKGLTFDMIFIDADKTGYQSYYEIVMNLGLLAPRGIFLVDNTMFKVNRCRMCGDLHSSLTPSVGEIF